MKNFGVLTVLSVMVLFGISCNTGSKTQQSNSIKVETVKESVNWEGVYAGVLPCADCPGIETVIDLKKDGSFVMRIAYQDRSIKVDDSKGVFEWNEEGNVIVLKEENCSEEPRKYLVEEGKLIHLDSDGNRITDDLAEFYILKKVDEKLVEKYWKLTEINGNPVVFEENLVREPHFILRIQGNKVTGNGGCNSIFGTYEVNPNNKIKFSQMVSTKMFCNNMEIETQLLKVFEIADNYAVADEKVLVLNDAEMKTLAKFEVVWLE